MLALILEHQVLPLSLKELVESVGVSLVFWMVGLAMGRRHVQRRVIAPAARRHQEQMAMHRKTHEHLKAKP